MNNIKKAAKFVQSKPDATESKVLIALAVALETNADFPVYQLYDMDREAFKLALGMIDDWRLDRYYLSRLRLLDLDQPTPQSEHNAS